MAAPASRWRGRHLLLGVTVVVVGSVGMVQAQLEATQSLDQARERTEQATSELHRAWAESTAHSQARSDLMRALDRARAELASARTARASAATDLGVARQTNAAAAGRLDRMRAEASAAANAVRAAAARADAGAALSESLADCLAGVSRLLNQLAVGDEGGALETVAEIDGPCAPVGVAVGR